MENKDTNTDYNKFFRVGGQKWEIVEITNGIFFFFCLRFVFAIFCTGSFQVPPKKNHPHQKWQFLPKIPIWPKSLLCKCSEKWFSTSPSLPNYKGAIFKKCKKNLYFLYEVKTFKISQDTHLIFKGSIYLGVFFAKMAGL